MMTKPILATAFILLGSGVHVGCAIDFEGESPAEAAGAVEAPNALTSNALTSNALTSNALTSNALTSNALTSNALTSNALTSNALQDPEARLFLKYVVSCALPKGKRLDVNVSGDTYRFDGAVGLAPSWGDAKGHCDAACRGWVSGCVLARVNHLGAEVPISLRGSKPALSSTPEERQAFSEREATYYGDVFATPQLRYACLSPGEAEIPRVCGPSIDGCVVSVVGSCDGACEGAKSDGSFPTCRDHVRQANGKFPLGTLVFPGSVTVFLEP
jgi:hypothetical protein